ncbi:hypothetical protein [[Clostridium] scindens]|uniref:hypothetical protein n=1 Tax=Clostridium scindens (strain JCM 10418 / VPI 12708) TaxID=29347 RepID=UPI00298C0366|nr:hypothetical protein [[Clostridium] scindens]WPB33886.1 hypothetical protein HCEICBPK_02659 [[Clostridium] scindens]
MQIITGIGESEHVTSMQHRAIFEMVIGNDSYILNKGELLEPELQSNNALKIRSGMLAHHGCISEVAPNTYDEVAIGNGSQSMKRIDLVVARYTQNAETKVERTEWTVIQGQPVESNPVAPDFIHGNMQDGDLTDDCPVFEVHLDGIQVVEIKKLLNVLNGSLAELNRKLNVSAADIISFTPLAGQNYPNWGGCYYYTSGSRVHVHLGIQALPANKVATVFVLPESVHPKTRILNIGPSGSFPGVARIEISLDGGINVTSQDTYAAADIEYDTYS